MDIPNPTPAPDAQAAPPPDPSTAVPATPQIGSAGLAIQPTVAPLPTAEDLAPKDTTPVPLANAVGSIKTVPAWQVPTLLTQGFRQPTQEELASEKYGGAGNTALGFIEHAAGAASADFSKVIENKVLGVPVEDIEGREQALGTAGRTVSSLLGFAGLTAATVATGGGAAEAEVASVPFGGFLTKALGSKVAASAASMAAYTAGQRVSEQMIGDAPFMGEASVAQIGLDVILSGAIGGVTEGALGLVGKALPAGLAQVKNSLGEVDGLGKKVLGGFLRLGGHPDDVVEAAIDAAPKAAAAKMDLDEYFESEAAKNGQKAGKTIADVDREARGKKGLGENWNIVREDAVRNSVKGADVEDVADGATNLVGKVRERIDEAFKNPLAYGFSAKPAQVSEEVAGQLRPNVTEYGYTPPQIVNKIDAALVDFRSELGKVAQLPEEERAFATWQKARDFEKTIDKFAGWESNAEAELSRTQQSWVRSIRHDVKDFLADQNVFGEGINQTWGDTQEAYRDFLQARGSRKGGVLKNLGTTTNGERLFDPAKVEKMLQKSAKNYALTGQKTPEHLAFEDYTAKLGNFIDKLQEAYKTIPEHPFSAAEHRESLRTLDEIKEQALAKYGMANAVKKLPGKSLALGGFWLPYFIMRHFGVAAPALPFVMAAYEAGRLVFRPHATIEAYGKLANLVGDTRLSIKTGAKAAAKALTAVDYAAHAAPGAGYYEAVDKHFRGSLIGGKKAASLVDASAQRREEIANYSDPEVLASKCGDFFSAYPPDTRQAAINTAARHFQVEQQILPPLPPTLGTMKPKPTESDAYDHAVLSHAMANPVDTIIDGVKNGNLTARKLAVIEATSPRIHQEVISSIMDELSQAGADKMGIKARQMVNLLRGQGSLEPPGYAEANQIAQGMSQPGQNIQQMGEGKGAAAVAGQAGAKTRKFKSDTATNMRLPMNDKFRPA